jgi:hypothetical protein
LAWQAKRFAAGGNLGGAKDNIAALFLQSPLAPVTSPG